MFQINLVKNVLTKICFGQFLILIRIRSILIRIRIPDSDPKSMITRIRDVYPGSRILIFTHPGSLISDPGSKTATKERGEKQLVVIPFYVPTNFTKLKIILALKCWKKNLGKFSKNYRTCYPKNCQKALQNMVLGSGIRDPEKTHSGSRIQGSKRHRIPDPNPQH